MVRDRGTSLCNLWKQLRGELERLRADMYRSAEELAFEEAATLRDRIQVLEKLELKR